MTTTDPRDVLAALTNKRMELGAMRSGLAEEIAELDQQLTALDRAIGMFTPQENQVNGNEFPQNGMMIGDLRRGEVGWSALDILRQSDSPMTAKQIAQKIYGQRKNQIAEWELPRLEVLVTKALRYRRTVGLVHDVGRTSRNAILWMSEHVWT